MKPWVIAQKKIAPARASERVFGRARVSSTPVVFKIVDRASAAHPPYCHTRQTKPRNKLLLTEERVSVGPRVVDLPGGTLSHLASLVRLLPWCARFLLR